MQKESRKLTAIDLYSGVGGWSLGLRMAGIRVVASYERWDAANRTNLANNGHLTTTTDIRKLKLSDLPKVDIVVGSPPCTQFSYSNRGGSGDIEDGLVDIRKFLAIVQYLRPRFWAMENVPRVAPLLERELKPRGKLAEFADLDFSTHVLNLQDFGLPQRRRRCIAGNFDFDLLQSYALLTKPPTLGGVVRSLRSRNIVCDPIYGIKLNRSALHDHVPEDYLNAEEIRINRAAKVSHVVYNSMCFPDPLDKPVRTITATCTRVSRESIVIETRSGKLRRLTIRERASLQGFPISFQFYGASHAQKQRMIGNAVPPLFSYYVGSAFRLTPSEGLKALGVAYSRVKRSAPRPPITATEASGSHYASRRTFRFAIPSLRLKSGVRFELRNVIENDQCGWEVAFIFGTPKSIHQMPLTAKGFTALLAGVPKSTRVEIDKELSIVKHYLRNADIRGMQRVWCRSRSGGLHPFKVLDRLDSDGRKLKSVVGSKLEFAKKAVALAVKKEFGSAAGKLAGLAKLEKNACLIFAGLLLAHAANGELKTWQSAKRERDNGKRLTRRKGGRQNQQGSTQRVNGEDKAGRHQTGTRRATAAHEIGL